MTATNTRPVDVARRLLAAADTDLPAFFATFTDNCRFRAGNGDEVRGREGVRAWAATALGSVTGLRHAVLEEFVRCRRRRGPARRGH